MGRPVRRLLLLGVTVGGLWILRRVMVDRAELSTWRSPGPPRLDAGHRAPGLPPGPPIRDLDAFRADRAVRVATAPVAADADEARAPATEPEVPAAGPPAGSPLGRAEPSNLDKVRERLASIHVDLPPTRTVPSGTEARPIGTSPRPRRTERWQKPAADGSCDQRYPIKVKVRSGLFHLPGMFAYERIRADRCYRSSADAEADGFERAKR